MKHVTLDLSEVKDWDSFHDLFVKAFDFPSYYGRNMNAWIDCMGDAVSPEEKSLFLHLTGVKKLKKNSPEIFEALNECAAFLNYRQHETGADPIISLSYYVE